MPDLQRRISRLVRRRYMESNCRDASHADYPDLPLKSCRYAVYDKSGEKHARVLLLSPPAKLLYRWLVDGCRELALPLERCVTALFERVQAQSSALFPVRGIVLEDVRPHDGLFEMYCFRDGVRVDVAGFTTAAVHEPNDDDHAACANGKIESVTPFARLTGTVPSEWRSYTGEAERDLGTDTAPTTAWPLLVRREYLRAWSGGSNRLMTAWAKTHLGAVRESVP